MKVPARIFLGIGGERGHGGHLGVRSDDSVEGEREANAGFHSGFRVEIDLGVSAPAKKSITSNGTTLVFSDFDESVTRVLVTMPACATAEIAPRRCLRWSR